MLESKQLPVLLGMCVLMVTTAFAQSEEDEAADYYDSGEATRVEAQFSSFMQPGIQLPAESSAGGRSTRTQGRSFSSYTRLARAPNMFGDPISVNVSEVPNVPGFVLENPLTIRSAVPLAAGRAVPISENNKPIPMDRVYYNYHGFQNAVQFSRQLVPGGPLVTTETNLNRHTFGFEKTFLDGRWSVDTRTPFTDGYQATAPGFATDSGRFGNISMYLKHLAYQDDSLALAYGLGVSLPTGSDIETLVNGSRFTIENEAVHLLPFVGFYAIPNDDWFYQGFATVDVATNSNEVTLGPPNRTVGRLTEQNEFRADLSVGRWLYQNEEATYDRGLAGVVELHYTTQIQDPDNFTFDTTGTGFSSGRFENLAGHTDVLNLTVGLHWQITEMSSFRVGAVAPLKRAPDRQFDSEIQASFNRNF